MLWPSRGADERDISQFPAADFLILITDSEYKGTVLGHEVYKATNYKVLPIAPTLTTNQLLNHPIEKQLLALVHSHLYAGTFHFSYTYDLTRRVQAQWVSQKEGHEDGKAPWQVADQRFFWNAFVQSKLMNSGLKVGPLAIYHSIL